MIDAGVLISQDLSCAGQVSLSTALPILGVCGLKPTVLPTAILSTHTGGLGKNTYLDLSSELPKIVDHWQTLDLKFQALYLGYLGQTALDFWLKNIDQIKTKMTLIDPAMADHGKMYRGLDEDYVIKMRRLISKATILTPNITEACLLLRKEKIVESITEGKKLAQELSEKFAIANVIITGIVLSDNKIGEAGFTNGKNWSLIQERVPGSYFGTGDIFASVFLATYLHKFNFQESCQLAAEFVRQAIINTPGQDSRFGPNYAAAMPWLLEKIAGK